MLSPDATTVATVPEKSPAIVPKEPAEVVQVGSTEAVKKLAADIPEFPSGFSTLILYVEALTGNVTLTVN